MASLAGRVAVVSGGGSGIGRALCRILSQEGATVLVADRHITAAKDTVDKLQGGGNHLAVECDVSCTESVQSCFSTALSHTSKPPTLLANAAGITNDAMLKKMTSEQFDNVLQVNLKGTFLMIQAFARTLSSQCGEEDDPIPGAVVNVSSVVAKGGNVGQSNYAASKAGVEALTKTAAKELARQLVRVNCVLPGFIVTPMVETVPEHIKDIVVQMIPLRRMGEAHEVAEVMAFLLSDRASYVTGSCVDVTGGLTGTM